MASEISKLAVVLTANSGELAAGLKGGENALNSLGTTANKVGGVFSGFTSLLGAVGLGFSLWKGFEGARESEQATARLGAVLRSTGQAAGYSADEMKGMAKELTAVTTLGGAAVTSAQAILATFTNIRGDEFKQAMTAAANLSTVLDQDLKSSVIQIGKALNDPAHGFVALKRAGVSFTQSQIEQIKTLQESGDIIGAQKIILGELSNEFGGAAEAAGSTFSGQIQIAQREVGKIGKAIGEQLLPAIATLATYARDAAKYITDHKDAIRLLAKVIVGTVAAVTAYKVAMFALVAAQRAWAAGQAVVLALQGPKGWITLAAAAGAAAIGINVVNTAFDGISKKSAEAGKETNAAMAGIRQQMAAVSEAGEDAGESLNKVSAAASRYHAQQAAIAADVGPQAKLFGSQLAEEQKKYDALAKTVAELRKQENKNVRETGHGGVKERRGIDEGEEDLQRMAANIDRLTKAKNEAIANHQDFLRHTSSIASSRDNPAWIEGMKKVEAEEGKRIAQAYEAEDKRRESIEKTIASLQEESRFVNMTTEAVQLKKLAEQGATRAQLESAAAAQRWVHDQKAFAERNQNVSGLIHQFEEHARAVKLSSDEMEIWKLEAAGANRQEVEYARSLQKATTETEKQKKAQDDLAASAKQIADDILTPWENYQKKLEEIHAAEQAGYLSRDQAARANAKAMEGVYKPLSDPQISALELRFTNGFRGDTRTPLEKINESVAAQLAKQTAMEKYLKTISEHREQVVRIGG